MKKKGLRTLFLAIFVGMIIGAVIRLERYAAVQLVGVLDDELKKSASCSMEYDSAALSFVALNGKVINPRVVCDGQTFLQFDSITATFSLSDIFEKVVRITNLTLHGGLARGVGPDSPTYKFIDHLSSPLPPEKDVPGRWKIQLETLDVKDSSFIEELGQNFLNAKGVGLKLHYNENRDAVLSPRIDSLAYIIRGSTPRQMPLGSVTSTVTITDHKTIFQDLTATDGHNTSIINADATKATSNTLNGDSTLAISLKYVGLPEWLIGKIAGTAAVSGTIASPILTGSFVSPQGESAKISPGGLDVVTFEKLSADFSVDMNHRKPIVTVKNLKGESTDASLSMETPLVLNDDSLSGILNLHTEQITVGPVRFVDVTSRIELGGTLGAVSTKAKGTVGAVETLGATLKRLTYNAQGLGDTITFDALHVNPFEGTVAAGGAIDLSGKAPVMKEIKYSIKNFPWMHLYKDSLTQKGVDTLRISGEGKASGPFDPNALKTEASISINAPSWNSSKTLIGTFTTAKGKLLLSLTGKDSLLKTEITLGLTDTDTKGTLVTTLGLSNLEHYSPNLTCSKSAGDLHYTFDRSLPLEGSGTLVIKSLALGCAPYTVTVPSSTTLQIKNGRTELRQFSIESLKSSITLKGSASLTRGFDLTANGTLPLRTFSYAFPTVDDISGDLRLALILKGTLKEPTFQGKIAVKGGALAIESAGLDISQLEGDISVEGTRFSPNKLTGTLNGGSLEIHGDIDPFNIDQSKIGLVVSDASFQPLNNVSLTTDASLILETRNGQLPTVSGKIELTNAEFEKRLDLMTLVRQLSSLLFSVKGSEATLQKLPPIGLDVSIGASRNIFVITNYFGSELKAALRIGGSLANPDLRGTMDSLSGWFGLKDQRFDMTSGQVLFNGGVNLPDIDITGETIVRSRVGDTITVYLEAKGPVTAPRVTLTSDSGLSQRDILNLLTTGGQVTEQTLVNQVGRDVETDGYSILESVPILSYSRFFRNLTRVDSLSIEPQYNVQSGAIEPIISARRSITEVLSLIGESYLGSQTTETRFGIVYNMLPNLNVAGYFASASDKQNVALEGNVTLTVLASQKRFVDFSMVGNEALSSRDILKSLKLRDNSRVPDGDMKRIRQSAKSFYRQNGYFDTRVRSICRSDGDYCRSIELNFTEGSQSTIRRVEFEGDSVLSIIGEDLVPEVESAPALARTLVITRNRITRKLRAEGYIAARVDATYRESQEPNARDLVFNVTLGKPVSFQFIGNKEFSEDEFLESINLFGRKIPFGSNTINLLTRNIDQMYREQGFLYANITHAEDVNPETGKISYVVTISEGIRADVDEVIFNGLTELSPAKLQRLIKKRDAVLYRRVYAPEYAVSELLDDNITQIKSILMSEGFPDAAISYTIEPIGSPRDVRIVYTVKSGTPSKKFKVKIDGLPPLESPPEDLTDAVFAEAINAQIELLSRTLEESGYLSPTISSTFEDDEATLRITVDPGNRTNVSSISIEGISETSPSTAQKMLDIHPGDPLDTAAINESRRKLLNLGLYSRVDVQQVDDGTQGSKKLIFRLTEKALQTLDVGGGFNTEYGVHLFGEGTDRSLFADGRALTLRLDAYVNSPSGDAISKGIASLKYSDPTVFDSRYTLTEDLRFQKFSSSTQEFDLDRTSFASNLYRAWNSGISFSFGHTILSENLDNVAQDVVLSEFDSGNVFLGYLNTVVSYDKRDNPLNPSRGYSLALDSKLASPAVGSEASFYTVGGKASFTHPFYLGASQFAIANALRGGTSWVFAETEYLPISQRYYLGGRSSIRGYAENSLGPRGAQEGVIGGDSVVSNNLEFQYRPTETTSINLFFDAGNVYLGNLNATNRGVNDAIASEDDRLLRYSTGVGVRYLSPIGPIGLDLGFPLHRRESDDPWRIHFNIGTNF